MFEPTAVKKVRNMNNNVEFTHPDTSVDVCKKLLNNKEDCDVFFVVGPESERIGAHKLILKARSSVFDVMFSPRWNEGSAGEPHEIVLEDDEPSVVRSFLEYIYVDMFNAHSAQAVKLLHLASFYDVKPLIKLCTEALTPMTWTPDEVIQVYFTAKKYSVAYALSLSFHRILGHFIFIGNSPAIGKLDEATLILILERDDLCVGEAQLFSILLQWADKRIEYSALDPKPERKDVLRNLLPLVRFPTMTPKEFAEIVVPTNLLPEQTVIRLFMYINSGQEKRIALGVSLPFTKTRRTGMSTRMDLYKRTFRPGLGAYPETVLRRRSNALDILTFKFKHLEAIMERELPTRIVSLVLQGPQCSEGLFKNSSRFGQIFPIKVGISLCLAESCEDGEHEMYPVNEEVIVDVGTDEMEVALDKPWEIRSDNLYKICLRFLADVYVVPASMDDGSGEGKQRRDESLDLFTSAALQEKIVLEEKLQFSGVCMSTSNPFAISDVPFDQAYMLVDSNTMSTGLHLLRALKISAWQLDISVLNLILHSDR